MAQLTLHWEGPPDTQEGNPARPGSHCVLLRGVGSTYNSSSKAGTRQEFKKGSKRADFHRLH